MSPKASPTPIISNFTIITANTTIKKNNNTKNPGLAKLLEPEYASNGFVLLLVAMCYFLNSKSTNFEYLLLVSLLKMET